MDENPYEAPRVVTNARTNTESDGKRGEGVFDGGRFVVSLVFTIGAACCLFWLVVFVGYCVVGTEWGHEFPLVLSGFAGTGFCMSLLLARITVPQALEETRRTIERLLLFVGLAAGLGYWLLEAIQ
jgi:hypothetical protein